MAKTPEELYREKSRRIEDAVELKRPDRVPFAPVVHYFAATYAGIGFQEIMYDYDKLGVAIKKMVSDLQMDICPDTFRVLSWVRPLEALDYKLLKWPGHGLSPDVTFQFVEGEYMAAAEYDAFLRDPSDFLMRTYLPRICGTLEPLTMLRPLMFGWYTRLVSNLASFGRPEVITALESLIKAGKEAQIMITKGSTFSKEMAALGFPRQFSSSVAAPFDYVGDYLRGTRGIMLDMYRNPDKLLEACDKILPWMIEQATSIPKTEGINRVFIPLHKGLDGFMSLEQFKTFFWPTLKKLMLAIIDAGLTPNPLFEGDCTSRLETIADMPRGKAIYWFERTDLAKAKEILGSDICIEGGLPASLLCTGSPEDVRAYTKKLIETVGMGGGFIMNGEMGIPDEARVENVRAMADSVREYGVYN